MLILAILLLTGTPIVPPISRVAMTHDGDFHDKDDIGAVAMGGLLASASGIQSRFVYLGHSNHFAATSPAQHDEMRISAEGNAVGFGLDPGIVHDVSDDPVGAALALAQQIERSGPSNRLAILEAGPWESMARAFDLSDPSTHEHVTIVSHSDWNDEHQHCCEGGTNGRDRDEFFEQYGTGGVFEGFAPPGYIRTRDGNGTAFRSDPDEWDWLLDLGSNGAFVRRRTAASDEKEGDMSDAVTLYWLLTGDDNPSMSDLQDFLGWS